MLSANLHRQVFPECYKDGVGESTRKANDELLSLAKQHLDLHKIPYAEPRQTKPNIHLALPPYLGNNVEEHFWRLGELCGDGYRKKADDFASNYDIKVNIKILDGRWNTRSGWTCYSLSGEEIGPCLYPEEDVVIFDVETCPNFGPFPLLAVALSNINLYAWVSPLLFEPDPHRTDLVRLIPMREDIPSLVIGHNVSFDRARIAGEYSIKRGKRRFLDTMSIHSACSGLSSQQRGIWMSLRKEESNIQLDPEGLPLDGDGLEKNKDQQWSDHSSMNNLAACVALHCNGYSLDKDARDILVKGSLNDVQKNFHTLLSYCAKDVIATYELYKAIWPKFSEKCPHPVTFSAILEMGSCFLPINSTWKEYYERAEALFAEARKRIEGMLQHLVNQIVEEGQREELYRNDPWLNKLNWEPVPAKYTKARFKKDGTYASGGEPRPIGNASLFGKPAWYRKIYCQKLNAVEITPRLRILPYLLRMKWNGNPVHFIEEHGWCYEVSQEEAKGHAGTQLKLLKDPLYPDKHYSKIPHHEREGSNVGSLMTKHHLKFYEMGVLTTDSNIVKELMQTNSTFTFWVGYRERIREQFAIWSGEPGTKIDFTSGEKAGIILPSMVTMGTVTRRAVEPLWMTASNAKKSLVGSELKSKVIAPDGWSFVGADVDSQELWISSLLGDAQFGFPGSTAMSWMTLQGARADNTDLHSRTAQILGMKRDDAKIFTYGRIYGAGVNYAAQLLQKFNPSMSKADADKKARDLYNATKGRQITTADGAKIYCGGSETFMFNVLEHIARSNRSTTPTLSCQISDSLISEHVGNHYLTSRVNWAVQSSGVDYLHMLVTSMAYLMRRYGIEGRLAITIHDEVRYLVRDEDKFKAALALQIANVWTRAIFARRVGMDDLPLSVAFFSAVDFDKVLRKEAGADCVTPSNPTAVPPGFALDIIALLQKFTEGIPKPVCNPSLDLLEGRVRHIKVPCRVKVIERCPSNLLEAQISEEMLHRKTTKDPTPSGRKLRPKEGSSDTRVKQSGSPLIHKAEQRRHESPAQTPVNPSIKGRTKEQDNAIISQETINKALNVFRQLKNKVAIPN